MNIEFHGRKNVGEKIGYLIEKNRKPYRKPRRKKADKKKRSKKNPHYRGKTYFFLFFNSHGGVPFGENRLEARAGAAVPQTAVHTRRTGTRTKHRAREASASCKQTRSKEQKDNARTEAKKGGEGMSFRGAGGRRAHKKKRDVYQIRSA